VPSSHLTSKLIEEPSKSPLRTPKNQETAVVLEEDEEEIPSINNEA